MIRSFSIAAILASCLASTAAGQESFRARIEQVAGDGLRIATPDGSQLVALYGLVIDDPRSRDGQLAKEFVATTAGGDEVEVRPLKVLVGLKYVEIVLPRGVVLNELMLEQGLARLDSVTASDNTRYKELELAAKAAGVGIWRKADDPAEAPAATQTKRTEPEETIQSFTAKRELRRVAEFDAQFRLWSALPEEYRQLVRQYHEQNLLAARVENQMRIAASQEAIAEAQRLLDENNRQIQEQQAAIAEQNNIESARLGELYNDPDFVFNMGMLNGAVQNRQVAISTQRRSAADASEYIAWEFSNRVEDDVYRLQQQAVGVSIEHEMVRDQHRGAIGYLASEQAAIQSLGAQAEARTRAAGQMANSQERRLSEALSRLDTLDRAIKEKYQPQTKFLPVETYEIVNVAAPLVANIDTEVWELTWRVKSFTPGATFSFDVQNADTGVPIRRVTTNRAPQLAFELFDGPGRFRVIPKLAGEISLVVEVGNVTR